MLLLENCCRNYQSTLNPEKELTAMPKTVLDYFTAFLMNNDVCNLFCSRFIYCGLRQRTVPELFYCFSLFPLTIKELLSHLCLLQCLNFFSTCKSFSKHHPQVGIDFILKILFPLFFPYGTFAYFLLVFTSIILSGLISEVVFTFFRVYRCLLKVSTLKIIPLLRKKLMLLLKSN